VGAREGEFMVEEEALEDDLSLREKSPIVAVVSVVPLSCAVEWDGMLVWRRSLLSWGAAFGGEYFSQSLWAGIDRRASVE
jgi:hypothetical protein